MNRERVPQPKYHDWENFSEKIREFLLNLQDTQQWTGSILKKVLWRLEEEFHLSKDKLLPLEMAALSSEARKIAEINAKLSKDLQNGAISTKTYEDNVIAGPDTEVFYNFLQSYGERPSFDFLNKLTDEQRDNYYQKIVKPKLLAARRERIKPFLPDENDVLD